MMEKNAQYHCIRSCQDEAGVYLYVRPTCRICYIVALGADVRLENTNRKRKKVKTRINSLVLV